MLKTPELFFFSISRITWFEILQNVWSFWLREGSVINHFVTVCRNLFGIFIFFLVINGPWFRFYVNSIIDSWVTISSDWKELYQLPNTFATMEVVSDLLCQIRIGHTIFESFTCNFYCNFITAAQSWSITFYLEKVFNKFKDLHIINFFFKHLKMLLEK